MRLNFAVVICLLFCLITGSDCQEQSAWKTWPIISWWSGRLGQSRISDLQSSRTQLPTVVNQQEGALVFCTWNIFRFGPGKLSTPDPLITAGKNVTRLQIILDQLANCDIAVIQEYMDIGRTVIDRVRTELVAKTGKPFEFKISPRVGKTTFEQYVFLYRDDLVEPIHSELFPNQKELFHREPYFIQFRVKNHQGTLTDFILGTIHTAPDEAVSEINNLVEAFDWAVQNFSSSDIMVIGDYNAACSYVKAQDWIKIKLWTQSRFNWIVSNDMDTTSMTTHCAYDRAVYLGSAFQNSYVSESVRALNFPKQFGLSASQAKLVSDHLLVRMEFR